MVACVARLDCGLATGSRNAHGGDATGTAWVCETNVRFNYINKFSRVLFETAFFFILSTIVLVKSIGPEG